MIRNGPPIAEPTLAEISARLVGLGLSLCHVDWIPGRSRGRLILYIDRDGGVTLSDCEDASREVSAILDASDEIKGAYNLEVSSPGLDRPLWSLDDCRRFKGRRVRVSTEVPVDGARNMKGTLEDVDGDALVLVDEDRRRRYTVRFGDVKVARLIPELATGEPRPRRERPTR